MAIQNAINLIREVKDNPELRKILNTVPPEDLWPTLSETGFGFTIGEFEECVRFLHVKCQTHEEADELLQTALWCRYLLSVAEYQ